MFRLCSDVARIVTDQSFRKLSVDGFFTESIRFPCHLINDLNHMHHSGHGDATFLRNVVASYHTQCNNLATIV